MFSEGASGAATRFPSDSSSASLFKIDRIQYVATNTKYVAHVEAIVDHPPIPADISLIYNRSTPIEIHDGRLRLEVPMHPGKNPVLIEAVDRVGNVAKWRFVLAPPPNWHVAPSCSRYHAKWEGVQAPPSSRVVVDCEPEPEGSGVRLKFSGIDVKKIGNFQGPSWQTEVSVLERTQIDLQAVFGNDGSQMNAKASLVLWPAIPSSAHIQASIGGAAVSSHEFGVSSLRWEPHLTVTARSALWNGRFEAALEGALGTLEASLRATGRLFPWHPAFQYRFSPFLDLGVHSAVQQAAASPLAPALMTAPFAGMGMQIRLGGPFSLAIAGHAGIFSPTPLGPIVLKSKGTVWDGGGWVSLESEKSGLWFLRTRFFKASVTETPIVTGSWSTWTLELGWAAPARAAQRGGLGVGL